MDRISHGDPARRPDVGVDAEAVLRRPGEVQDGIPDAQLAADPGALVAVELVVAMLAVGAAATMVSIPPAASRQGTLVSAAVNPAHLFGTIGPSSQDFPATEPVKVTVGALSLAAAIFP